MVCGDVPFEHDYQICSVRLVWRTQLSRSCRNLVRQCLAKDPSARPSLEQILRHPWLRGFPDMDVAAEPQDGNSATDQQRIMSCSAPSDTSSVSVSSSLSCSTASSGCSSSVPTSVAPVAVMAATAAQALDPRVHKSSVGSNDSLISSDSGVYCSWQRQQAGATRRRHCATLLPGVSETPYRCTCALPSGRPPLPPPPPNPRKHIQRRRRSASAPSHVVTCRAWHLTLACITRYTSATGVTCAPQLTLYYVNNWLVGLTEDGTLWQLSVSHKLGAQFLFNSGYICIFLLWFFDQSKC